MPKAVSMWLVEGPDCNLQTWKCGGCDHDFLSTPELNVYYIEASTVTVPQCPRCKSIWNRAAGWETGEIPQKTKMELCQSNGLAEQWKCSCGAEFDMNPKNDSNCFTYTDHYTVPHCPQCKRIWDEDFLGFSTP